MASTSPVRLLPAGAFGLAALLAVFWALSGGFPRIGGLFLLLFVALPALIVPLVLVLIALGLMRGKKVARAAAAVVTPLLGVLAAASSTPALLVLAFLLGCGTVVALVLVPDLRAQFADDRPSLAPSIALVRVVVTVFATLSAIAAVLSLVLMIGGLVGVSSASRSSGGPADELVTAFAGVAGTLLAGVAVVGVVVHGVLAGIGFWARGALVAHSAGARVLLTVVLSLALIGLGVASAGQFVGGGGLLAAAACLHAELLVLLWLPSDTRVHFGQRPIVAIEDLRRHLLAATGRPAGPGGYAARAWPTAAPPSPPVGWPSPVPPPTGYRTPPTPRPSYSHGNAPPNRPEHRVPSTPPAPSALDEATTTMRPTPAAPAAPTAKPASASPDGVDAATVSSSRRTCAACDRPTEQAWTHCPHCGTRLPATGLDPRP